MTDRQSAPPATVSLIPGGHQGRLTLPGDQVVPVRVFERGDVLMLVILLDRDTGDNAAQDDPALLEYSSAKGLVRLEGRAKREARDLIRFAVASPGEVLQRRDFVRIDVAQPVAVTDARDGRTRHTHAVDISGGGMLLEGLEDLSEGQRVRFSLELDPGAPPVQGAARVVRTEGITERGLKFETISEPDRERLIHFIFDRERAARAITREGARRSSRRQA